MLVVGRLTLIKRLARHHRRGIQILLGRHGHGLHVTTAFRHRSVHCKADARQTTRPNHNPWALTYLAIARTVRRAAHPCLADSRRSCNCYWRRCLSRDRRPCFWKRVDTYFGDRSAAKVHRDRNSGMVNFEEISSLQHGDFQRIISAAKMLSWFETASHFAPLVGIKLPFVRNVVAGRYMSRKYSVQRKAVIRKLKVEKGQRLKAVQEAQDEYLRLWLWLGPDKTKVTKTDPVLVRVS